MIKTVIFDMDGVIVDTEPVHKYAYYKQFDELGIAVPDLLYSTFTGFSTRNTFEALKAKYKLNHSVEDLIQRKRALFNDAFDTKNDLELLDGVENLIKSLYKNGMCLLLASSASKVTIERVFNRFHLHQYFKGLVSGEDFPQSKPNPAIFEYATSLSPHLKNNCIVIEDSTNGIKAAKSAGLLCIGYNSLHSKNQDLSEADWVINHFNELSFEKIRDFKKAEQ